MSAPATADRRFRRTLGAAALCLAALGLARLRTLPPDDVLVAWLVGLSLASAVAAILARRSPRLAGGLAVAIGVVLWLEYYGWYPSLPLPAVDLPRPLGVDWWAPAGVAAALVTTAAVPALAKGRWGFRLVVVLAAVVLVAVGVRPQAYTLDVFGPPGSGGVETLIHAGRGPEQVSWGRALLAGPPLKTAWDRVLNEWRLGAVAWGMAHELGGAGLRAAAWWVHRWATAVVLLAQAAIVPLAAIHALPIALGFGPWRRFSGLVRLVADLSVGAAAVVNVVLLVCLALPEAAGVRASAGVSAATLLLAWLVCRTAGDALRERLA